MFEIERTINFPPNQALPDGYAVIWSEIVEHYIPVRLDGTWEGTIFSNRFAARRCALDHAKSAECDICHGAKVLPVLDHKLQKIGDHPCPCQGA